MTKTFIIAALIAGAIPAAAQAQEASVQVRYGDLDLTHEAGVARFDRRIARAVDEVCGDPRDQLELSAVRAVQKCGRNALAEVAGPRQIAIAKARGQVPSVDLAVAGSAGILTVRRR